jgi:hypothetical protein
MSLSIPVRFLAILGVAGLSACVEAPGSAPTNAVAPFLDRPLVSDGGDVFLIRSDGTIGGQIQGDPIAGTYETDGTEICSVYTSPAMLAGREFCSTPVVTGDRLIFERRDGSRSQAYTIDG